ncbi:MAG: CDP-alcohol phosphatidyltransferase family protein [Brumimicrobium sp.]|nr:CDP-alcohol phosphatidyltransferase family protein [Brumimicrobium sp.]MCO5269972.1 CDP-alcohol phosphatidyltransferase family protein [Brumimicrobium sp.]
MAKLNSEYCFLDFSDYGRIPGRKIAFLFKNTFVSPIHLTSSFIIVGTLAIIFLLLDYSILAGLLLILKSIIDASDGALARIRNNPSYVGRYYDSIADFILNFLFLLAICIKTESPIWIMLIAFFCMELQGTLYNFYYVIQRHKTNGDETSQLIEKSPPKSFSYENQKTVNVLFFIYKLSYGTFDRMIYSIDIKAIEGKPFPNWFMSILSFYGLGFQLLIMALLLSLNLHFYIIPFFIFYSIFIPIFVFIRKLWL